MHMIHYDIWSLDEGTCVCVYILIRVGCCNTLIFIYVLLCSSVMSILSTSYLLDKSTQHGGEDSRRFSSRVVHRACTGLCLSTVMIGYQQRHQDNRQPDRQQLTEIEECLSLSTAILSHRQLNHYYWNLCRQ